MPIFELKFKRKVLESVFEIQILKQFYNFTYIALGRKQIMY